MWLSFEVIQYPRNIPQKVIYDAYFSKDFREYLAKYFILSKKSDNIITVISSKASTQKKLEGNGSDY